MASSTVGCLLILLLVTATLCDDSSVDCARREVDTGIVCVCNSTYCDEIQPLTELSSQYYQVYTSNKAGLRFERKTGVFEDDFSEDNGFFKIIIDKNEKHQKIVGWGGAFTDSFGINLQSLDEATRAKLMRSYFSKVGIEYNIGRVPIGATDFSTRCYTYDDSSFEDIELNNFQLASEDYEYKLPYLKDALKLNNDLKLFASAWTAPKWMKTNGEYEGFGTIKKHLYQTWADYHKKFLDAYNDENIVFWGITTGSDPLGGLIGTPLPTVGWRTNDFQRWIGNHFGPTIRTSKHKDLKIMIADGTRLLVPWYLDDVFANKTIKDYIDMVAIQWYWNDLVPIFVLDEIRTKYPELHPFGTEASTGSRSGEIDVILGSWERGEKYATNIIQDMLHYFVGWTDWNMALNTEGGPNYAGNNADAPIIVDADAGEFYKQPMYYSMGHFSKFVPRGSVRIDAITDSTVLTVAFLRPDQSTAVILQNKHDHSEHVEIADEEKGTIHLTLSPNSLTTLVYH